MRWIGEGIQLVISIHALRKESDIPVSKVQTVIEYFNPRSP